METKYKKGDLLVKDGYVYTVGDVFASEHNAIMYRLCAAHATARQYRHLFYEEQIGDSFTRIERVEGGDA